VTLVEKISCDPLKQKSKELEQLKVFINKEDYRLNDIKMDLQKLYLHEKIVKSSPLIRIEVALRDCYGLVYDTMYLT
jgi:hypothetical protein